MVGDAGAKVGKREETLRVGLGCGVIGGNGAFERDLGGGDGGVLDVGGGSNNGRGHLGGGGLLASGQERGKKERADPKCSANVHTVS